MTTIILFGIASAAMFPAVALFIVMGESESQWGDDNAAMGLYCIAGLIYALNIYLAVNTF